MVTLIYNLAFFFFNISVMNILSLKLYDFNNRSKCKKKKLSVSVSVLPWILYNRLKGTLLVKK